MGRWLVAAFIVLLVLFGIAIAYQDVLIFYFGTKPPQAFNETAQPLPPDYGVPESWAARPGMAGTDYAEMLPAGVDHVPLRDRGADVFFIHGTTTFKPVWNERLDQTDTNWRTDSFALAQQASVFSACCRIFAPRYRQAGLFSFVAGGEEGAQAVSLAYDDVRDAFLHFLTTTDGRRPFIVAGHSQGAAHALRLLSEVIEGTPLENRLVAVYAIGYWLPDTVSPDFIKTPVCETPEQTGCLVSYDTIMEGGERGAASPALGIFKDGAYQPRGDAPGLCVNPLSFARNDEADASLHKGGLPMGFMTSDAGEDPEPYRAFELVPLKPRHTAARCGADGSLYVSAEIDPHFRVAEMPGKSLHPMDMSLFWGDLRANALVRVHNFTGGN